MKEINTNKLIAYLTLLSGLTITVVAEYYSILGLTAIFSAAVIPVIVMGIALGMGKITGTLWLKQNWSIAPWSIRCYLIVAIATLMLITSMGIFGFLSKAHSDQSLVSGDVLSKLAVVDEKINTAKENIDANRKALKQLDEAVDQTMGRSTTEAGANKAVSIRRSQQAERKRLLAEIQAEQKIISRLTEEAAPIRAEVRRVEAEVGPLKYIAQLIYGEADPTLLEKSVTWVILLIIFVFDPLALILLISSQVSFQKLREQKSNSPAYPPDDGPLTNSQIEQIKESAEQQNKDVDPVELWNTMLSAVGGEAKDKEPKEPVKLTDKPYVWQTTVFPPVRDDLSDGYVQNEEQAQGGRWNQITKSTQISEKDYNEAVERNIEEMVDSVRKGILPFYKVPYEIQDQVKQKLQNGNQDNSNNAS